MDAPSLRPAASTELVEPVAAAFHTLVRSWHHEPNPGRRRTDRWPGPASLSPWLAPTDDPAWQSDGRPEVDVANTWWESLPVDWRATFREVAAAAAAGVVEAIETGRSATELDADEAFVDGLAAGLRRPWLDPPQVLVDGEAQKDELAAERALARVAIHVYAARLGGQLPLGFVPEPLSRLEPEPGPVRIGGRGPGDETYVSLRVHGERLDPDELTRLTGLQPDTAHRRGDLNMSRDTGRLHAPYQQGLWLLSSETHLTRRGTVLEDHVQALLAQVEPHGAVLVALSAELGLDVDFGCYYAQMGWNASWSLKSETLRRIAAVGASLWYDSYADIETPDGPTAD